MFLLIVNVFSVLSLVSSADFPILEVVTGNPKKILTQQNIYQCLTGYVHISMQNSFFLKFLEENTQLGIVVLLQTVLKP